MDSSSNAEITANFELVKNPRLIDFFSNPIAILKNENILFANKAFETKFSVVLQPKSKTCIKSLFNVNDNRTLTNLNRLVRSIDHGDEIADLTVQLRDEFSSVRNCKMHLKNIQKNYFLLEITPVSENTFQRKLNQTQTSCFENVNQSICIINSRSEVIETNSKFYEEFKIGSKKFNNKNIKDIFADDWITEIDKAIKFITRENTKNYDFETEFLCVSGGSLFYKVDVSRIDGTDNFLITFINQSHEIGLLKKLTEAEEKAKNLKSIFVAQVSHEIRTPINAILSFATLLKEELKDKLNPELQTGFDVISRGGDRIVRTINLILDMSDVMTGTYDYTPAEFDVLSELFSEVFLKYKKLANERNIECTLSSEAQTHSVFCDNYMVKQILSNILDNAVKFTYEGKIEASLYSNESGRLCIDICDTGIGISEEYLANIFEPFSQEDEGIKRRYEGNGLGLALTKKYCDINNIDIRVENNNGRGVKVKLEFNNTMLQVSRSSRLQAINL